MGRILVTGALGQIASALVPALREIHGNDAVIASDIRMGQERGHDRPFEQLDVCDAPQLPDLLHIAPPLSPPHPPWQLSLPGMGTWLDFLGRRDLKNFS